VSEPAHYVVWRNNGMWLPGHEWEDLMQQHPNDYINAICVIAVNQHQALRIRQDERT